MLLANGATDSIRSLTGHIPIQIAVFHHHFQIFDMLMRHRMKHGEWDLGPVPLLHCLGFSPESNKFFRFLRDVGFDINTQDQEGRTPLMEAVQGAYPGNVRVLLEAGADIDRRDNKGRAARNIAEKRMQVSRRHGPQWKLCAEIIALIDEHAEKSQELQTV